MLDTSDHVRGGEAKREVLKADLEVAFAADLLKDLLPRPAVNIRKVHLALRLSQLIHADAPTIIVINMSTVV
jgi:hypothetical protein